MTTISAPWTAVHNTPNKSIRQNVARRGVVLHHAAMTSLSTLRDMEVNGTKEVSSTAICKDDAIELVVSDDRYRPWSLASSYWDSAMRSVETCNESTTGWTVSDRSHWSLAKAVAYWSQTDGFWPHRDGDPTTWTVIGHREVYSIHDASYATACPGGLDLNLVVARAQSILNGTAPAGMTPVQIKEIKVKQTSYSDRRSSELDPGVGTVLKNAAGAKQDITGGLEGPFSFTPHVYAQATPGDAVDIQLVWLDRKTGGRSGHFVERAVADKDGLIRRSVEFKRSVAPGYAVTVEVTAVSSNVGPVTVSVLDADAFLFVVA